MNTSTTINRKLFIELPYPLAMSWDRVLRATSATDQIRQIKSLLDTYFRYTSGILLAAYLREPPKPAVEQALSFVTNPSMGHYCQLIREILRYFRELQQQQQQPHFFSYAVDWYWDSTSRKDKKTKEAERLDDLVTFRNHDAHGLMLTEQELTEKVQSVLLSVQSLLYNAKWLTAYSLFCVSDTTRRRGGGEQGKVHFYKGISAQLPVVLVWSPLLYTGVVYLSSPNGEMFLEVDPFIIIEQNGRRDDVFLWCSTPKNRRIDLRDDSTSTEKKYLPILNEQTVQWSEWLERRSELEGIQTNEQTNGFKNSTFQDVGSIIDGHYRIVRYLGAGGMATVYEVFDEVIEETLALKILPLEQVDTMLKERTKIEFKLMQKLSHPNILSVKSIDFLSDGRIAIGLPLMFGTLKDYVEDQTGTVEQVRTWGEKLLSALDYLHHQTEPIYHRDVKPSNVLYDVKGQVFLADFGIARQTNDVRLTRTNEQMGSIPYMAPEVLRGDEANHLADRYSLAVTLHEILLGKLPQNVGEGIEGNLGSVLRKLGSTDPSERAGVRPTDFRFEPDVPVIDSDQIQQDTHQDNHAHQDNQQVEQDTSQPQTTTPVDIPTDQQSNTSAASDIVWFGLNISKSAHHLALMMAMIAVGILPFTLFPIPFVGPLIDMSLFLVALSGVGFDWIAGKKSKRFYLCLALCVWSIVRFVGGGGCV